MTNRPETGSAKDPVGKAREVGNGNGVLERTQPEKPASSDFPTDLRNLSEADKKKWFRIEDVGGGRSILKVRTELLNLPDEEGEPGFLEKICSYKIPLKQDRTLIFDKDF